MRVPDLLARVAEHGFRVNLGAAGPELVPLGDGALPAQLLADLKAHRAAVVRHLTLAAILGRGTETSRPVWGYCSDDGKPVRVKGKVIPAEWDRACVEGDERWTEFPREVNG